MRERPKNKIRLEHILESIANLYEFTNGSTFEEYANNKILRFAVIKNLEIIGEAAYMLTNEFKDAHPEVEWRDISSMRHVLVHGYYQISDRMVWQVIQKDLADLESKIKNLLKVCE